MHIPILRSKLEGSRIHLRHGQGIRLRHAAQRIIVEAAAFVPGIHYPMVCTQDFFLRTAAAMAAIGAGGFDLTAEKQRISPHLHYTPDAFLFPHFFTKTAVENKIAPYIAK